MAGFNPDNPLGGNPDRIGDYSSPLTHELLFGVEHELFKNFGVSANLTWRRYTGFNWLNYPGVTAADFTQAGVFSGTAPGIGAYNVPYYHVNEAALPADLGQVYETRTDYSQKYLGFEVAATKRMADRWMMRIGFSTNMHRKYLRGPGASEDPTPVFTTTDAYPKRDGGEVMVPMTGSGKSSIYLALPRYQFIANGAYQAKWGVTFAANYVMRQGFSAPYFILSDTDGAGDAIAPEKNVLLVSDVGDNRLPAVHSFDGRVSKNFTYRRANIEHRHGHLQSVQRWHGAGPQLRPVVEPVQSGARNHEPAHHPLRRAFRLLIPSPPRRLQGAPPARPFLYSWRCG